MKKTHKRWKRFLQWLVEHWTLSSSKGDKSRSKRRMKWRYSFLRIGWQLKMRTWWAKTKEMEISYLYQLSKNILRSRLKKMRDKLCVRLSKMMMKKVMGKISKLMLLVFKDTPLYSKSDCFFLINIYVIHFD